MALKKNRRKWSQTVETSYSCPNCETTTVVRGLDVPPPTICPVCNDHNLKKGGTIRVTVDVLVEELQ